MFQAMKKEERIDRYYDTDQGLQAWGEREITRVYHNIHCDRQASIQHFPYTRQQDVTQFSCEQKGWATDVFRSCYNTCPGVELDLNVFDSWQSRGMGFEPYKWKYTSRSALWTAEGEAECGEACRFARDETKPHKPRLTRDGCGNISLCNKSMKLIVAQLVRNILCPLIHPEGLLSRSQEPATGPCYDSVKCSWSVSSSLVSLRSISKLSSM